MNRRGEMGQFTGWLIMAQWYHQRPEFCQAQPVGMVLQRLPHGQIEVHLLQIAVPNTALLWGIIVSSHNSFFKNKVNFPSHALPRPPAPTARTKSHHWPNGCSRPIPKAVFQQHKPINIIGARDSCTRKNWKGFCLCGFHLLILSY